MVFYILWRHSPSFPCQSTVVTLFAVFNLKRFYFSTFDALGIILVDAVFLRRRNAQLGSDRQIVGIGDYIFVVQVNVYPESVMSVEFAGNVAQICSIGNLERLFSLLALLLRLSRFSSDCSCDFSTAAVESESTAATLAVSSAITAG